MLLLLRIALLAQSENTLRVRSKTSSAAGVCTFSKSTRSIHTLATHSNSAQVLQPKNSKLSLKSIYRKFYQSVCSVSCCIVCTHLTVPPMQISNRKRLVLSLIAAVLVFMRFRLQQTLDLEAAAALPLPSTMEAQPFKFANTTAAATPPLGHDTALLVICANRPQYLQRSLDAVQKHYPRHSTAAAAPVVRVSQDGDSSAVKKVISSFTASMQSTANVQHLHCPLPTVAPTGDESIGRHWMAQSRIYAVSSCACIFVGTAPRVEELLLQHQHVLSKPVRSDDIAAAAAATGCN
jgi:hypothetical protein